MEKPKGRLADLDALVLFQKVVEANGFSKAARSLAMPTSTLSRRVAELEDGLGVRLLERSTRSLRLTEIGSEVLRQAQIASDVIDAVETVVSNHLTTVAGQLRLSAPPSVADSVIAPLINAFQAAYPAVTVHVFITDRFVDLIREGIDATLRIGRNQETMLRARPLLSYRHRLLAAPAYLASATLPRVPEDLREHHLVSFAALQGEARWQFVDASGSTTREVRFRPYLSMNDYTGIVTALLAGNGIGEVPPIVAPDIVRSGRLVEVMPAWQFPAVELSLVSPAGRHVPRSVRVFEEFATQMLPTLFPELQSPGGQSA